MNGRALRQARRDLAIENARWSLHMQEIPPAQWPDDLHDPMGAWPERVWRSRDYLAVLWSEPFKEAGRLSIIHAALNDRGRFMDGIGWDDLQRIKSECGLGDRDAVELYPCDVDVVDVANMRHLWILPALSDLAWRSDPTRKEVTTMAENEDIQDPSAPSDQADGNANEPEPETPSGEENDAAGG